MYAYSGILTALLQRHRTGEGTALEVSLFEALGEWMGYAMYYTMGGTAPGRTGASHATIAPYGPYQTRDGQVIFGIQNNREWTIFSTEVLRRPELANARINTVEQFIAHPQLAGRQSWRQVDSPVGPLPALVPPVRMEDVEPVMAGVPALGQHSRAILAELGFDADAIERWKQDGII
jgi:crotonobetainyl-CoA:carnitine CoA-transferase CaiB-like acyl-CoA transferase